MVVLMSLRKVFCVVIGIVAAPPQLNVMIPPVLIAFVRAASVQLAGVPVPTTVVGLAVLTAEMGEVHTAVG